MNKKKNVWHCYLTFFSQVNLFVEGILLLAYSKTVDKCHKAEIKTQPIRVHKVILIKASLMKIMGHCDPFTLAVMSVIVSVNILNCSI